MAQTTGHVSFVGVCVQMFFLAVTDGFNEVLKISTRWSWCLHVGQRILDSPETMAFGIHLLFIEINLIDTPTLVLPAKPRTSKTSRFPIIENSQLGICGLGLIFVAETTPDTDDAFRPDSAWNHPPGDVHLMDALISDVSVFVVPKPMPIVMDEVLMVILIGAGPVQASN